MENCTEGAALCEDLTGLLQAVWLVGGRQKDADTLVKKVPALAKSHPVLIPQEPLAVAYSRQMNVTDGYPSTGFVGALLSPHTTNCPGGRLGTWKCPFIIIVVRNLRGYGAYRLLGSNGIPYLPVSNAVPSVLYLSQQCLSGQVDEQAFCTSQCFP